MPYKVLIVDDDANLLEGLCRVLRHEPYTVLTSTSGEKALELIQNTPVEVIISDHDMPHMSGAEFLKFSQAYCPSAVRMMLTGKGTLKNAMDAINRGGISRFFLKPCDPSELAHAIREGIQQYRLTDAAFRLLQKNKTQSGLLRSLEKDYPDISKVERDTDGAIRIEEFNGDLGQLLEEIDDSLKEC